MTNEIRSPNVEQVRLCRQRAAGILPAKLFSDPSAGKMPAARWGSWLALLFFHQALF